MKTTQRQVLFTLCYHNPCNFPAVALFMLHYSKTSGEPGEGCVTLRRISAPSTMLGTAELNPYMFSVVYILILIKML